MSVAESVMVLGLAMLGVIGNWPAGYGGEIDSANASGFYGQRGDVPFIGIFAIITLTVILTALALQRDGQSS